MSTTLAAPSDVSTPASASRIASIDLIRGTVMILIAIDQVRVYSGHRGRPPTVRTQNPAIQLTLSPLRPKLLRARARSVSLFVDFRIV